MVSFVVFAKEPRPGRVKTRLVPPLTHEQAARLATAFVRDLVRRLLAPGDAEVRVALPPGDTGAGWLEGLGSGVRVVDQGEGDLGDRLDRALTEALADGARIAVAVGADHPDLPRSMLDELVSITGEEQCGWIPTEDGGYAAIGLGLPQPGLFRDVPWSTPRVAEITRNRARESGVSLHSAGTWRDVDVADDLMRLAGSPDSMRRCPETRRILQELEILPPEGPT